jgi:hypothetical protein
MSFLGLFLEFEPGMDDDFDDVSVFSFVSTTGEPLIGYALSGVP